MHEYSVVASLIELCEENAKKHQAKKVERIVVAIGERAGMDKSLFISAFEGFREESEICKDARLELKDEKVTLKCKNCENEFAPQNLEYGICPRCQSSDLSIIKGRDMYLMSLDLVQEDK